MAKPGTKASRLYDSDGLYLEIARSGGMWWRFKYRYGAREGKQGNAYKLLSLGIYPAVTLAKARRKRDKLRALVADGVDPGAQRKAEKREALGRETNCFEFVAREWQAKQAAKWTEKHADDVRRRLESNLFPDLDAEPIAEITAPMLLAAARKVESRGAHDLAHRTVAVAGQVFRYGVMQQWADMVDAFAKSNNVVPIRRRA